MNEWLVESEVRRLHEAAMAVRDMRTEPYVRATHKWLGLRGPRHVATGAAACQVSTMNRSPNQ